MKNINKKGFTLVELVIVIAAVAILAGLIIFTFANAIKKANDSAAVQNAKNDEIAQKADDIIKKIDESNWFGWEDFETEIVTAVAKAVKENNSNAQLNKDEIKSVVEEAVVTALANIKGDNTELTEDQVKAIVENAMGSLKYEGVTEAQVRAIVNGATATLLGNQLTVAQVRAIVNAANENNLTSVQLANVLASQLGGVVTVTDLNNKMETLQTLITNTSATLADKDDVQDILDAIDDIKNNVESAELDDVVTAKALNIRIKNAGLTKANTPYEVFEAIGFEVVPEKTTILLSIEKDQFGFFVVDDSNKLVNSCGLNIAVVDNTTNIVSDAYKYWVFVGEYKDNLVYSQYLRGTGITGTLNIDTGLDVGKNEGISEIKYKSSTGNIVVIRTNGGSLEIDAASDTVKHYGNIDSLNIIAVASTSYHENGEAGYIKIANGRLVVEESAKIDGIYLVANASGEFNGIKLAVVGSAALPTLARADVNLENGQSKLVVEIQILQTSNGTDPNPEYVWISKSGNEVSAIVSTSDDAENYATNVVETPSQAAAATKETVDTPASEIDENSVARVNAVGFATLQEAFNYAKDNDTVYLLKDYNSSSSATNVGPTGNTRVFALGISKSIVLEGNGYTVTSTRSNSARGIIGIYGNGINVTIKNITLVGSTHVRGIETRGGGIESLTLENVTISSGDSNVSDSACLQIGGNQSSTMDLKLLNCTFNDSKYGILFYNAVNGTISNTTIIGWSCLYFKGPDSSHGASGSVVNVNNNSLFDSSNPHYGASNSFGMIVFEDNLITVDVKQSELKIYNYGDQCQAVAVYGSSQFWKSENTETSVTYIETGTHISLNGNGAILTANNAPLLTKEGYELYTANNKDYFVVAK